MYSQFELLSAREGLGVWEITHVEIWKYPEDALVLFYGDLPFGKIFDRDCVHGCIDGLDAKLHLGYDEIFAFVDDDHIVDLPR
jgi:hypothetical protein